MKQNGKWKRLPAVLCSLAVALSAFPAMPLKAEAAAGVENAQEETAAAQTESREQVGQTGNPRETELPGDTEEIGRTETEDTEIENLAGLEGELTESAAGETVESDAKPGDGGSTESGESMEGDGTPEDGDLWQQAPSEEEENETEIQIGIEVGPGTEDVSVEMADMGLSGNSGSETEEKEESVMLLDADSTYTDADGNIFAYALDAEGGATITGITVSGNPLAIPETVNGAAVTAVSGGGSCVVANPETAIPSLYVNCGTIGAYAFSGLAIGELTVGEDVACFAESEGSTSSVHYWMQFAEASIGTFHFYPRSAELGHSESVGLANSLYGPFHQAVVGELDIGSTVEKIPEALLYRAELSMEELTIGAGSVGACAFAGGGVSIGTLIIGSRVSVFEESYYSSSTSHCWNQFAGAFIGKLRFYPASLEMGHTAGRGLSNYMRPAFEGASIGALEIGEGVSAIPEYFLYQAKLSVDELTVGASSVGAYAFSGRDISIGTLTIGETVAVFREDYYSSDTSHHWSQFAEASVGKLRFYAVDLAVEHTAGTGLSNNICPPFAGASVGTLEIGEGIEAIPEYLLYQAKMEMESLVVHAPVVGAYAFAGGDISIGTLTIGETVAVFREDYYSSDTSHRWNQFAGAKIGTLRFLAAGLVTGHTARTGLSNYIYPAFEGAEIGELEIGEGVTVIPEYFLYQAALCMEELEIHVTEIGAYAFAGEGISFGTLTIGREVETFAECHFSRESYHYWNQFMQSRIGHLVFSADEAATVNGVAPYGTLSAYIYGPFQKAEVGALTITENVERIPDYFFYNAKADLEDVYLDMPFIGALAFMGGDIAIGTLTIGENVEHFAAAGYSSSSWLYWNQFGGASIGTVNYNAAVASLDDFRGSASYFYSPFCKAKIGTLHLGGNVDIIPPYCFHEAVLEQGELEIHAREIGGGAFYSPNISIGTLTIGEETESLPYVKSGSSYYYRQFASAKIGTLVYEAKEAVTGTSCDAGPFEKAQAGSVEFGEGVLAIPNYLFYNAKISFGDFTVNVPVIGYYSFSSRDIAFETLTIGEDVSGFPVHSSGYSRAFNYCTVDSLHYDAAAARLDKLGSGVYGPFAEYARIKELAIGENVTTIPYACFRGTAMELEELTIENAAIGYRAFYGSGISIGTLNIGKGAGYDGAVSGDISCFGNAKIGTLNYNGNAAEPAWSVNTGSYGMFASCTIGRLNIGEDVEEIPAFWFRGATIKQDTLTVPCAWSYYAFYSSGIEIGTLELNGDVEEIRCLGANNYGFRGNAIGTVIYNLPSAVYNAGGTGAYGPFYGAAVTDFVVGERVKYLDDMLLRGNSFEDCRVYSVEVSAEFSGQTLANAYLPSSENLHIHHNSGFAPYFTARAGTTDWMCGDFYEVTYGKKVYDGEAGEYRIEVIRRCPVCGYEEGGTEDLDESYDVHISIPAEIPLAFSESAKSYEGSGRAYAYGRLGNAYEGVRLSVDADADNYGTAKTEESETDIFPYLSAGFRSGGTADFTPGQVSGNGKAVSEGDMDAVYADELAVSVKGAAFLRSGAGDYHIPVPLRIEVY